MKTFFKKLAIKEGLEMNQVQELYGGSINQVYLLTCNSQDLVVKVNDNHLLSDMFEKEQQGLNTLTETATFGIPNVFSTGEIDNFYYLLLEYIPTGEISRNFWRDFAERLASLHKHTHTHFGFSGDNYIGSLIQYNSWEETADDYYINQRLKPQLKMAEEKGYSFKDIDNILENILNEIPNEKPALIHGDLWSGNYLAQQNGIPYLIDPAVSYGIREIDLAMMKLFGGFPNEVFEYYHELFPLENGFSNRVSLFQLYFLLVHLNLFGSSYLNSVEKILRNYRD